MRYEVLINLGLTTRNEIDGLEFQATVSKITTEAVSAYFSKTGDAGTATAPSITLTKL